MYEDDAAEYRIKNWIPPWIDNGERLKELIDVLIEMDDDDAWKVASVLLVYQLDMDIRQLKSLVDQINEIERLFEDDGS